MIELKNITVIFNRKSPLEKIVLRDFNLKVDEGDFLTIIGGNGAGKSTLMNLVAGEIQPFSGSIFIDGEEVTRLGTDKRAKYVSRVFQDPLIGTCANLTIEENLSLALKRGLKRTFRLALQKNLRGKFRDLLAELGIGLEDRLKDPMASLSGGQRQSVSLLMSTIRPSRILLLDEHTAALDPKMAKKVLALSHKLIEDHGLTTLMITHSMHQALEFGNRTLVMQQGKVIQDFEGEERKALTPVDLLKYFEKD